MEQQMNCFLLRSQTSDYLDGTLKEPTRSAVESHLENCADCAEVSKRYRLIISTLSEQPKAPLPLTLKKSPYATPLPRGRASQFAIAYWEEIPWFVRTLIEGIGIVFIILLGVSSAPKIRSLYETSLEKSLSDFRESSHITENREPAEAPPQLPVPVAQTKSTASKGAQDDLAGEGDDETDDDPIHVGRSQLWRFTLKTVSPDDFRPQVIKALTEMGIPPTTDGIAGTQVPGGIEFDLTLPQDKVQKIKTAMENLSPSPASENFSWYRVKSKRQLPEGSSQVVIWLSQPN